MEKEIVISRFEYDFLKALYRKGFRYIARDCKESFISGLWFYRDKPIRRKFEWVVLDAPLEEIENYVFISKLFFQFVKWEDEEPTLIEDLIKHYELQERN